MVDLVATQVDHVGELLVEERAVGVRRLLAVGHHAAAIAQLLLKDGPLLAEDGAALAVQVVDREGPAGVVGHVEQAADGIQGDMGGFGAAGREHLEQVRSARKTAYTGFKKCIMHVSLFSKSR